MKRIIVMFLTLLTLSAYGQTDKEKALELCMQAIEKMDAGNMTGAIELLEVSCKLDPDDVNYPYELGLACYLDKNYKKAIKVFSGITKHPDVTDQVYQMLGNSYDLAKKPKDAVKTYETGLAVFPNSGRLHLERGNMEIGKDYSKALYYYEKGIEVQPEFPSNYFRAAKIFLVSTEEVWGMIYGEIFMNLERNTKRTEEMSKLLYDTYKSQIQFSSDTAFSVSFSKNMVISAEDISDSGTFRLPFGLGAYEPVLIMSLLGESEINPGSLDRVRTNFVRMYYENGHNKTYPNVLFDYQKEIMEKGHLEAYNRWLLMKGDEDAFMSWMENNKQKWEDFVDWFTDNPIHIDGNNKFCRSLY